MSELRIYGDLIMDLFEFYRLAFAFVKEDKTRWFWHHSWIMRSKP